MKSWWDMDSMIDWEDANWLPIEGYEDRYLVSDTGLVMNYKGKLLKQKAAYNNERRVSLITAAHTINTYLVAKLVAKYFVPNPQGFKMIVHIDGDPSNNRATNLRWDNVYRKNPFKLDNKFYKHLHAIEAKYGSIAKAPYNDKDYITIQHIVGNC